MSFSVPFQIGTDFHLVLWALNLLLGVKRQERGLYHKPPSSAEDKERVGLYI
jgi:hypothetical protein